MFPVHVVYVRHVMAAFSSLDGKGQQEVRLSRQEVTWALNRMFDNASQEVSQEVSGHVTEEMCNVMLRLFDVSEVRGQRSCYLVFLLAPNRRCLFVFTSSLSFYLGDFESLFNWPVALLLCDDDTKSSS